MMNINPGTGPGTSTSSITLTADTHLDPKVVDYVVSLNPHDFERLRVPFMRRVLAPRVTLGRLAKMTYVPLDELLRHIASLDGAQVQSSSGSHEPQADKSHPLSAPVRPDWAGEVNLAPKSEVDLLPIDQTLNADPLPPVMRFKHKWGRGCFMTCGRGSVHRALQSSVSNCNRQLEHFREI